MQRYADIVLPLAQKPYTFAVEGDEPIEEGRSVAVPFGRNRVYAGIVWRLHDRRPDVARVRSILRTLGDRPILPPAQKALWEWTSDYYMCTPGEVMRAALPALLKPGCLPDEELSDDTYVPPTETYVAPTELCADPDRLDEIFRQLERRAPRQFRALLQIVDTPQEHRTAAGEVPRRLLKCERSVLQSLARKGLIALREHERTVERPGSSAFRLPELSAAQQAALGALGAGIEDGKPALLFGVTGSGKTEVYMHLIARTLSRGDDVLMLVPEIALTAQLIDRMEQTFGSRVTTYHSKLSDLRRTQTFLRLNRSQGGELVVGVRSSVFLPLRRLRLIVVDEEHDASYKQSEPAPRYNARDCAVMLGRIAGAGVVLGSATPSLESWSNALSGKYALARIDERWGGSEQPRLIVSDTLRAVRRGERRSHFNGELLVRMGDVLERGGQVMLYQNRRGFAPFVACSECGWTARCPRCNVTLTWHKGDARLLCHYCGHTQPMSEQCPECGRGAVQPAGFGTEKVEQEVVRLFPEARVGRLDRDSVTSERAFRSIVDAFARGEKNVLVGTQMITKGFDFAGVSLVGILNADNLLNMPDFRASERAYQVIVQVAGRAGRRSEPGEVVIQTAEPDHPVIRRVLAGDYEEMARTELAERKAFFYPPYARIVALMLRHRDPQLLRRAAVELGGRLRARFRSRVLGPMAPPVDRIRDEWLAGLLLKIESGASMVRARELLAAIVDDFRSEQPYRNVRIVVNVDPQ